MAHSLDFREEVVRAHAECGSSAEVALTHHCSESWVRRMTQQKRETGSVATKSSARIADQRAYNDKDEAAIRKLIKKKPDATLAEVAAAIGKPACTGTVCRTLQRMNLPRKKSPRTPPNATAPTCSPNAPPGSDASPSGGSST
jgi:transposase